jgi:tRNA(fMet)-specific endonuclease VapC
LTGTSGRYLLDTNIVVAYLNNELAIRQKLTGIAAFVPVIVIGELCYGAYKSSRKASNLKQIRELQSLLTVLPCDTLTADQYGQIKLALQTKGRPIPENDIWIAAFARQHGLTLVTRDDHFKYVDGLVIERW